MNIWASAWQNLQNGICAQRRLRSAWASAQYDQSSLSAWRKFGFLATHWVHSKDSDQTGQMPRLIWVFAGRTCRFVGFVMCWLIYVLNNNQKSLNEVLLICTNNKCFHEEIELIWISLLSRALRLVGNMLVTLTHLCQMDFSTLDRSISYIRGVWFCRNFWT